MRAVKVKICGITNEKDAVKAVEFGADFVGFNFSDKSPRKVSPQQAKDFTEKLYKRAQTIGVFVNQNPDHINTISKFCGFDFVQLHGDETPDVCEKIQLPIIKAFRLEDEGTFKQIDLFDTPYILLDAFSKQAYGGTGELIDEKFLPKIRDLVSSRKVFLSGGLTPENVHTLVEEVKPFAVDVASGVEIKPGLKSPDKMKRFILEAKK